MSYLYFDQVCKQKIIDILNDTKKILNRIVSISAKLVIKRCFIYCSSRRRHN